jgi:hypothetical protein
MFVGSCSQLVTSALMFLLSSSDFDDLSGSDRAVTGVTFREQCRYRLPR